MDLWDFGLIGVDPIKYQNHNGALGNAPYKHLI
jgi:hypothetical protein